MNYVQGYVAFIDILGFSTYVSDEQNADKTKDLFTFVEKFRFLYNTSPKLHTKVSFFSDSIVITSDQLESIILAICIAESYLKENLGLLFRGGICYGKYHHDNNTTFGPAVISAYKLEKTAVYSRIILDNQVQPQCDMELLTFIDIDGKKCLNSYGLMIDEMIPYGSEGAESPEGDITEIIADTFAKHKSKLLSQIQQYKGTDVVSKYLWRIRPYNYTCDLLLDMPCGEMLLRKIGYSVNEDLKKKIGLLKITENEIMRLN